MANWPWIERTFTLDFPASKFPDLLERVRGTPARIEARVHSLSPDVLTRRDGKGWSIQENIGHLLDLGYLPLRRIVQILAGEAELIAAGRPARPEISRNPAAPICPRRRRVLSERRSAIPDAPPRVAPWLSPEMRCAPY